MDTLALNAGTDFSAASTLQKRAEDQAALNRAFRMSAEEQSGVDRFVNEFNNKINEGRKPQQELGRDDFLKLLIAQLSHQDPTAPMQDKEFIAQMSQFSTLEQMTNMASDFSKMTAMLAGSEASGALGKSVSVVDGDMSVQGVVSAVTRGADPQVLVNGKYYSWTQVQTVFNDSTEQQ
jgi:flagellar basal-body rod modification protein FlgD